MYLARVNTTPQGTPVPMQPPPPPPPLPQPDRTPFLNVPPFPTINANVEDRRCTAHFGESEPRGDGSSSLLGNTRQSEWQKLFRGEPVLPSEIRSSTFGVRGEPVGERQGIKEDWDGGVNQKHSDVHDVGEDPWKNVDLATVGPSGGRDPFLPGERTYWTLPTLGDPAEPGAPTRAADWFTQIRPLLYDLSDLSQLWWDRVEFEARQLYRQWSLAAALDKGLVLPEVSSELSHLRFRRLESRAFGMLQTAVPQIIRDELLASRSMHCVGLIYQVLKVFCPGGLQERAQVLTELTALGTAKTASDAVHALRGWTRSFARARTMGVVVPDPALVLKGVDAMTESLLKKPMHAQVAFRISTARNQLHLDHRPNMSTVVEFMRVLQSEWEQVAVSGVEENTSRPKAARVEVDGSTDKGDKPGGKGNRDTPKGSERKGAKGNPTGQDQTSSAHGGKGKKGPCSFYLTSKGCSKGRDCGFFHDFASAKGQGRCFACGSDQHRQQDCTRPKGKGKGKPLGASNASNSEKGKGVDGGSGSQPNAPVSNPETRKEHVGTGSDQGKGKGSASVAVAQAQVLEEAQKLLKSLRIAALKVSDSTASPTEGESPVGTVGTGEHEQGTEAVIPKVCVRKARTPKGLLDGGATHPLRTASQEEWDQATPTTVAMAVGTQTLRITPVGTILTREKITPICPLGQLVELLGCKVIWDAGRCKIRHPTRGSIKTELEGHCPVVDERLCLELIKDLERRQSLRLSQALSLKALGIGVQGLEFEDVRCPWGSEKKLIEWIQDFYKDWPEPLKMRAIPSREEQQDEHAHTFLKLNRRHRKALQRAETIVLHLFSGDSKVLNFADQGSNVVTLNIDVLLGRDLMDESAYSWLAALCSSGKVGAVLASPPTGSFRKRVFDYELGKMRFLRGSTAESRFGMDSNLESDQQYVDQQSVLLLRTLVLHHLADEARKEGCMLSLRHVGNPSRSYSPLPGSSNLESSPRDRAPSLWSWPQFANRLQEENPSWFLAEFEKGGGCSENGAKAAVFTNSWFLYQSLHNRKDCDFAGCGSGWMNRTEVPMWKGSKVVEGRWTWGLKGIFGSAVRDWIASTKTERRDRETSERVVLCALTKEEEEFKRHCEQDHVVFRKDCRVCLQSAMRGQRHLRQKHQHANALTLNLDLIGPWIKGEDHLLPGHAKHILVATLGVPIYEDGQAVPLQKEEKKEEEQLYEQEDNGEELGDEGGGIGDWDLLNEENEEEEGQKELEHMNAEEMRELREKQEAEWREIEKTLKAPVKIHNLLFAEPLTSKKSEEVLRAIQRVYARINLLNLSVRRAHSDGGREFTNKAYKTWCAARDIHVTYSPPADPRSNGRVEGIIGQVKAGIRALLTSQPSLDKSHWPSALRQYVAQKFALSMKLLGGPPPKRPLVPFGTPVTVQSRNWSRKTPYAPRAISGVSLCPAANVTGCTVVLLPSDEEDVDRPRFHVAPVLYQGVKEPLEFQAEEIQDEEPPSAPRPARRLREKLPVVAHACVGGESGSESGSKDSLEAGDAPDAMNPNSERLEQELPRARKISGESFTVEQSEGRAAELLASGGEINREDLDELLEKSLTTWNPKRRKCDVDGLNSKARGWTLGFYVYGNQVGITRETRKRPILTRLLNQYLAQEGGPGHWTAMRVTSDFTSDVHVDRNLKGTQNLFVPVSSFQKGRIWVEGVPGQGETSACRMIDGIEVQGKWIGGSEKPCWFDSSKRHAVEPATGVRRVIVGYTPRRLEHLTVSDRCDLEKLGFPLPEVSRLLVPEDPIKHACTNEACETRFGEDELKTLLHEHAMLRNLLIEEQKSVEEEVATAAHEGWTASTLPLQDLHAWIDECEQGLVWQDSCDLLSSSGIGEAEQKVLEARLAKLGVAHELGTGDGVALGDDEDGDAREFDEGSAPRAWEAQPAQPLQTVSVSHQEVLKKIEEWKGSIGDELSNVFDVHEAMRRRSEADIQAYRDAGDEIEIIPAKALFHKKGGSGRNKCRVVACGNYSESAKEQRQENPVLCRRGRQPQLALPFACCWTPGGNARMADIWIGCSHGFLISPIETTRETNYLETAIHIEASWIRS